MFERKRNESTDIFLGGRLKLYQSSIVKLFMSWHFKILKALLLKLFFSFKYDYLRITVWHLAWGK